MRILAALLVLASTALADVPRLLSQEGRLLRADGTPERGTWSLTFALYTTAAGGVPVWTETVPAQLSPDGYYAVVLGSVPLPAFVDGQAYFIGITVAGESEMTPRTRLVSTAYALQAGDASRLGGAAPGEYLRRGPFLQIRNTQSNYPNGTTHKHPGPFQILANEGGAGSFSGGVRFTAPTDGVYMVGYFMMLRITPASYEMFTALFKNGAHYRYLGAVTHQPGYVGLGGAMPVALAAGDYIEPYIAGGYSSGACEGSGCPQISQTDFYVYQLR